MQEPILSLSEDTDPAIREQIGAVLVRHNEEQAGAYERRALLVTLRDPQTNAVIGGLAGRTALGFLFIDLLVVPAALRGGGWGSRILAMAEDEARKRGCRAVALNTANFQAPEFYRRHGYRAFGEVAGDPGISRIFMTKTLTPPAAASAALPSARPRARDLGIPFTGTPGPCNAITDVAGVEVGYSTLIEGSGRLEVGKGPVRTGVTAILPRGKTFDPVFAGWYALNGNGEMTGTTWVEESGFLEGPIMITNTHSVGVVRDAVIAWQVRHGLQGPHFQDLYWLLPVVGETWDGILNDINGMHVKAEHVDEALDSASTGPLAEGNVGGGTGMNLFNFKGGTGTASRKLPDEDGGYMVGALVQGNFGSRRNLTIAGVPVGEEITDLMPDVSWAREETGSIIVVIATDAPLLPHQLKRLARRVPLGMARTGGHGGNGSGDIFIAFSTANPGAFSRDATTALAMTSNDKMTPLMEATVHATEEAIVNAMIAAETMTGRDDNVSFALPHDRLREVLKKYNRLGD